MTKYTTSNSLPFEIRIEPGSMDKELSSIVFVCWSDNSISYAYTDNKDRIDEAIKSGKIKEHHG